MTITLPVRAALTLDHIGISAGCKNPILVAGIIDLTITAYMQEETCQNIINFHSVISPVVLYV